MADPIGQTGEPRPHSIGELGGEGRFSVCARFDALGFDGTPARLGIMGGTFDPIHIGHLAVAEQAREAMGLDAVVFIPTGHPVFKRDRPVSSAADRLEMCRLAVEGNPFFDTSDIEIRRGGDTYTVDTLRQLRSHYPSNVELWFITGADAVASIVKWRESAAIAGLAKLIAVTRPGFPLTEAMRIEISSAGNFDVRYMEATALSVSSSDLRARVAAGRSIRYLTMARVCDYIREHRLYCDEEGVSVTKGKKGEKGEAADADILSEEFYEKMREELRERLPKKSRYRHSLGVAEESARLARLYGVDERKARLAGLLHDWDKGYDDEGIRARVAELGIEVDPFLLDRMPRLLHGPTAAAALARRFPDLPADVVSAIERHTAGAADMGDLDMIVYIADVIEPHRDFPGVDDLRALPGAESLEDLFVDVAAHVFGNLIERRRFIHPQTLEVWNHCIARKKGRS